MPVVSVWSRDGGVLGAVAPIGLAAAAGTAIVVDLDTRGPHYPGDLSLADLVRSGPRRDHLVPARRGVCLLRNGGVPTTDAAAVIDAIVTGWPAVVLRLPTAAEPPPAAVEVHPLVPGGWFPSSGHRLVLQSSGWRVPVPQGAILLPRPRRATLSALLTGAAPRRGDRWIRSWRGVWDASWM
jgi:hypothetical protein